MTVDANSASEYRSSVNLRRDLATTTTAIHVYRVRHEAVSNIARHANVREAHVQLRFEADTLTLDVREDERGLLPGDTPRGLSLVAMRERAELQGGTIEILRPPGGGTLVRLRVPISAGSAT